MIPSILHQIYFSHQKNQSMPWQWNTLSKKSRKYLKHWYYYNWDFEKAISFVKENYPEHAIFFKNNEYEAVIQSDIFRYIVLYHYGGWYMDFDCEITHSLDEWNIYDIILPLSRDEDDRYQPENMLRIGNAVLASKKNHPFWLLLLSKIKNKANIEQQQQNHTDAVVAFSGPWILSKAYHSLTAKEKKSIYLPKRKHFHSPIPHPTLPKHYKQLKYDTDIYCIHYAHGLWKQGRTRKELLKKVLLKNSISYFFICIYKKIKAIFNNEKRYN